MSIGERAALAIEARAKQNGTSIETECNALGGSRKNHFDWKNRGLNPNAYFLQQMVLTGYDVIWILTGGMNEDK